MGVSPAVHRATDAAVRAKGDHHPAIGADCYGTDCTLMAEQRLVIGPAVHDATHAAAKVPGDHHPAIAADRQSTDRSLMVE
jgi:hypothetical protein